MNEQKKDDNALDDKKPSNALLPKESNTINNDALSTKMNSEEQDNSDKSDNNIDQDEKQQVIIDGNQSNLEEEKVEEMNINNTNIRDDEQEATAENTTTVVENNVAAAAINEIEMPEDRAMIEEELADVGRVAAAVAPPRLPVTSAVSRTALFIRLGYTEISLYLALIVLWYALRTRREFYPAVLYLSSSKLSYVIFGNALAALALSIFQIVCSIFLGGLRSAEREAIRDGMRWSMTETCLALTMFREEVSVNMGGMFLLLIMCKCWHWAVELRGKHLIQTEEAITIENRRIKMPWMHMKYLLMVIVLSVLDVCAIVYCVWHCVDNGPSVHILFGFESVILAISAFSAFNFYYLHFLDGFVNVVSHTWPNLRPSKYISYVWKDYRLTLNLSLDLVSYSAKFLSYLLFFFIVFTYYGMPFNIFREVYISCLELRKKMIQFASYRRLSSMMDTKFHTCDTDDELEDAGRICIICRDALLLAEHPKKLPGCGHVFHKYCLKGWLMQQNSCPTCRRDIMAAVKDEARLASVEQRGQQQDDDNNSTTPPTDQTTPNTNQPLPHNNQEKRRLSSLLQQKLTPPDPNTPPHSVLPALYKVVNANGVNIIESRTKRTLVLRNVPVNKMIICTHVQTWKINDEDVTMLLMPDGWVSDKDVQSIRSIPIPQIHKKAVERDALDSFTSATTTTASS